MKYLIIILCLAPSVACRGQVRNSIRNRKEVGGFVSFPSVTFLNMPNHQLNDWVLAHGGKPIGPLVDVDFFKLVGYNGNLAFSFSLGQFLAGSGSMMADTYADFGLGFSIIGTEHFQSNLLGHVKGFRVRVYDAVPPSITQRASNDILLAVSDEIGISTANYLTIRRWQGKSGPMSLAIGVEYGVDMVVNNNEWQYGHFVGRGRNSHFSGVTVHDVPNLDPFYTYVSFSVSLGFN